MAAARQEPQPGVSNVSYTFGSGNTSVSGAAGHDVRQEVRVGGGPAVEPTKLEEARALLDQLRTALGEHSDDVKDPAQCDAAVTVIGEQLESDQPEQSKLKLFLTGLLSAIGGVTDVLGVAEKLRDAIQALFA
ncbi:hypothetical protein ACGF3G_15265 [Streptomyces sp. NPDC048179]|uniref:hypothetical protein n=1 Tax=Streptomyces sp. NPDC048179 TaxID=3365506 RepID=UPI00371B4131